MTFTGIPGIIMNMKIHLPNSAFLGNINALLAKFDPSEPDKLELSANDKWIAVHPVVLAMVGALGLKVKPNIVCSPMKARSAHYLVRMKLFDFLGVDCDIEIQEHEEAGRFIPLTQIRSSADLSKFISNIDPLLHLQRDPARAIKYVISELVWNVLEHAYCPHGAVVAAQYFKQSNKIGIGIADTGIGIRQAIGQSWPTPSNREAIRLALMPGITGTTRREGGTEQNAGAGLFFIKSIASVNQDFFVICSGDTMYKLLKRRTRLTRLHADPFDDRHSMIDGLPPWPGTLVGVDISLDQSSDFADLLDSIRNTYDQAVRERKKTRLRKPRFI